MSDVDFYIIQFEPEVQRRLMEIRFSVLNTFLTVDELIYHGVPTFTVNGKDIMNYGAYKDHITIYLGYDWVNFLKNHYPQYHYTKAAMQIPNKDPFPDELIKEICELLKQGCLNDNSH